MNATDAQSENTLSWHEIVSEHADEVYRLAYRLTGNQADAEDLTQDTFMRAFNALEGYKAGNFAGWLHRITTNLFLDKVRRQQRIRMEALSTEYEPQQNSAYENTPVKTPEQEFEFNELDPVLEDALNALAPEYKAALVLHEISGMSYEDIAETLGVKMGTVRSRIHRARTQLRNNLELTQSGVQAKTSF